MIRCTNNGRLACTKVAGERPVHHLGVGITQRVAQRVGCLVGLGMGGNGGRVPRAFDRPGRVCYPGVVAGTPQGMPAYNAQQNNV